MNCHPELVEGSNHGTGILSPFDKLRVTLRFIKIRFLPLSIIFYTAIFCTFASTVYAGGELTFPHKTWDFGKISGTEKHSHRFSYKNSGDEIVTITNVTPSCGCTAAAPENKIIKPGNEGFIYATFNPVGKKGKFSTTVTIETSARTKPYVVTLKADITVASGKPVAVKLPPPMITVHPLEVNFGTLQKGQTAIYKIIIGNDGVGDLYIRNFNAKNEISGVPLDKKPIKENKKVELTAFYDATKKGKINDKLFIFSNDPQNPTITIILTGVVE
ncbi:MAG: hypothetical protein IEMM0002_1209 [bacterium]|nr:MAG: hypothetical protein IEMM0002_1209 [bacterium]